MRIFLLCLALSIASASAKEPVRFNAHANADGTLSVELTDDSVGTSMRTTLSIEKTRRFVAWLGRHEDVSLGAAVRSAPPAAPETKSCGFGDFLGGKC